MFLDLIELSGKNLRRRGKRSWLTIIGILIGIAAIVSLFSVSQGLEDSVNREFEDLGANVIYVLPGSGLGGLIQSGGGDGGLGDSDLEAVRRVTGVDEAGPTIYTQSVGEYRGETQRVPLIGIPTDSSQQLVMRANAIEIETGRGIRPTDRFSGLAGTNLDSGDVFERELGLRGQITIKDTQVRVIGIILESGDPEVDRSIVLDINSVRQILDEEGRIDYIIAEPLDGQDPVKVAEDIKEELRQERNVQEGEERFSVSTASDLIESSLGILDTVQYVVIGIVSIALLVGGLGVMNTMYMSVSERTKEIGIMKAIGASKRQILSIYLIESGILGLIGGLIGTLLGLGISEVAFYFIRQFAGIPLYPDRSLMLIGGSLGASFLLGVFSGYLPARKAAKLEPVEAIRQG
jgi:putative ABC transport system permease protein